MTRKPAIPRAVHLLREALALDYTTEALACDYAITALVGEGVADDKAMSAVTRAWHEHFTAMPPI